MPLDLNAFPAIATAAEVSTRRIELARAELADVVPEAVDVVGFGSLARREMTDHSDFDFLALVIGLPDPGGVRSVLAAADGLRRRWLIEEGHRDTEIAGPGGSGLFGKAVGAFDLVHQIGLQEDTNHSLTRRMLLLEESVSLAAGNVHAEVVRATLARYLEVGLTKPERVPRFLANDVVRYWRTITVDYQAKAREGPDESGLRYLKLIITRKVLFAGTMMSLLLCGKDGWHRASVTDLADQFTLTPLARLVQGYDTAPDPVRGAMEHVVRVVETFLERSGDAAWRARMKQLSRDSEDSEFDDMRRAGDMLQSALESIFFDWDVVAADAQRTLAF